MGADIHCHVEAFREGPLEDPEGTWFLVEYQIEAPAEWPWLGASNEPFGERVYAWFAWLADVRNWSAITPLAPPRGMPDRHGLALSEGECGLDHWKDRDYHSHSWFTVAELLAANYDQIVEDRRDGGDTVPEGRGERVSLREFLGKRYFEHLAALEKLAEQHGGPDRVRIVFWFDN